ncbi:ribosomal biogenesis regulatory protein [Xylariomycetidae sp. FL2044]|nr:ribosomal biogenesis regulatory protein [Xylariomycetidae sp. FL2044]
MAPPKPKPEVTVNKPTPYTFDLGLLLTIDANPLSTSTPASAPRPGQSALEAQLHATARDAAQVLIGQLLTTCPITSTPSGVLLTLPPVTTALPREKPVPEAREPTKWEQFAARKGIKPKTREQRRAKGRTFNEATGEWEKTWGYDKGGQKRRREEGMVQSDWLVEVDEKKEKEGLEGRAAAKGNVAKKRRKA